QHPPLRIDCQLVCARDVDVAEADVSRIDAALGEAAAVKTPPRRQRVDVEATVPIDEVLGGHEAIVLEPGELLAERDRDGDPHLVIDRMLEVAPEHPTTLRLRCQLIANQNRKDRS